MYQSIGINLSKKLDAATKKIKVPAITQRSYYKDSDNCEEEYINLYKYNCDDNNTDNNFDYLDDDYNESIDSDSECACGYSDLFMDKIKNIDSKVVIMAGVGALIGFIGLYKLLKRR
ncbi:hypothetical protein [Clostridium sp. D53t1_180928_C8]|uniref:hypothetical protein n=1 Tax=Clostridium sp. D53t1_180928_C8 TaxID=2787101 RepID=UPI0018AC3993|nr:hypothetical protein [Clostridium sp. D53t1_180928_C8]